MRLKRKYRCVICCTIVSMFWMFFVWIFFQFAISQNAQENQISKNDETELILLSVQKIVQDVFLNWHSENNSKENSQKQIDQESQELGNLIPSLKNNLAQPERCQEKYFLHSMPISSIIFHQEASFASLLRSVASLLLQTSLSNLREIIVIDASTNQQNFVNLLQKLPKVVIIRKDKQIGSAMSRIIGAEATSGEILLFADSRCFFRANWAPPLLHLINQDYKTVAVPTLQHLSDDSKPVTQSDKHLKGGFNWKMKLIWIPVKQADRVDAPDFRQPSKEFRSPVVPGGCFLMSRKWWNESKGFDPGFDMPNFQIMEFSLMTWHCGGNVKIHPCSNVAYVSLPRPRQSNKIKEPMKRERNAWDVNAQFLRNSRRMVEIWFSEFSRSFYNEYPTATYMSYGDIKPRKAFQETQSCKTFRWFLTKVYPELSIPKPYALARGQLFHGRSCVSTPTGVKLPKMVKEEVVPALFSLCEGTPQEEWEMTEDGWIKQNKFCLGVNFTSDVRLLVLLCLPGAEQRWQRSGKKLVHGFTGMCLDSLSSEGSLIQHCTEDAWSQHWEFTAEIDNEVIKPKIGEL